MTLAMIFTLRVAPFPRITQVSDGAYTGDVEEGFGSRHRNPILQTCTHISTHNSLGAYFSSTRIILPSRHLDESLFSSLFLPCKVLNHTTTVPQTQLESLQTKPHPGSLPIINASSFLWYSIHLPPLLTPFAIPTSKISSIVFARHLLSHPSNILFTPPVQAHWQSQVR
ncbi:hypothetical protein K435DRAFT_776835 [Dendrothele bispora CBS 962.96]|uniref:Uncharacterized protein n=1 Tax=Dendrothele bispora (strain CBS 962.96) TaxID=1314807 RepID=A0A4S8MCV0_DENBC|nr:hypothetical protein K435DRAFT_776835 [Dendrothele bispora CBS 962.96]